MVLKLYVISCNFPSQPWFGGVFWLILDQWEFQDPKMEVR